MSASTTIVRAGHTVIDPATILTEIASTEGFTRINPHLSADPNLRITPFGPERGIGAGFAFSGKDGKGTQTVTEIGDTYVEYGVDMGILGKSTQRITATPSPLGGSDLSWSIRIRPGLNPLQRVFTLFANKVLGPTAETGINNLASSLRS